MTKIVSTIGPSSDNEGILSEMAKAGMDVARLNFSHGTHAEHQKTFEKIRDVCEHVAIAIDIAGPKIRIGRLKEKYELQIGDKVTITNDDSIIGTRDFFSVNYSRLHEEVKVGSPIFINDGLVKLEVTSIENSNIHCEVKDGGTISTRKGVNVPDANLTLHVPTKKDEKDIEKACELEVDYLFISFVRNMQDLIKVKEVISSATTIDIPIISKIEHSDGVKNIREILSNSDGLMVARGDLGIEVGPACVPVLQKQYIKLGIRAGKPVIVATQMLESMTKEPIPTRAEASDVAHAVFDGTDAVMLSAETATGDHPVVVIETMSEIIREAERSMSSGTTPVKIKTNSIDEVIGSAAVQIGQKLSARAIIAMTQTGYSARMVSRNRISLPIFAITPEQRTMRKVQLNWGVKPIFHPYEADYDQLVYNSIENLLSNGFIDGSDTLVLVGGSFLGIPGKTNTIQVFSANEVFAGKH
ncbi:MAG: pyruvate kinase [Candidatus Heimdallarchaeaceae archaeon]